MQEVGLYLMYDMRWSVMSILYLVLRLMKHRHRSYMNDTAVTEEVNRIKNRPNLLLWYTGDEPDGTSGIAAGVHQQHQYSCVADPLDATSHAYDLIYSLDGYHPVSLVL